MSLAAKIRNVFRQERLSRELDHELAFHIAERQDELIAQGLSEQQARRMARACFGNYSLQKETTRDMNLMAWLEATRNDLAFGLRQLRLNPGFTLVAVLSLALGIGANTAIFQLVNAIRLRGLPVHNPAELALLSRAKNFFTSGWQTGRHRSWSSAQLRELGNRQQAFSGLLSFNNTRFNLASRGQARYAEGLFVSPNFLQVLGVAPYIGRDFSNATDGACASPGVILSYSFWQRQFGGDTAALGRAISLNRYRFTVIGITPPEFFGVEPGQQFDVAVPLCADRLMAAPGSVREDSRTAYWLTVLGRLKPGWTLERATAHVRDLSPAIMRASLPPEYRPENAKQYLANRMALESGSAGVSAIRRQYQTPLFMLLAISGMVLLIACLNLANLLLARASARERELAVRQAIGASRPRLISQLLSESVLLAAAGALAGLLLAQLISRALVFFISTPDNQILLPLGVDWQTFSFTASLAIFTCLLFGLLPAWRASRTNPSNAMRGARTSTASRERNTLRRVLVVSQVAFSLVLLVAAVLFSRSLQNLLAQPYGFQSDHVLIASVTAARDRFPNVQQRAQLFRQLEEHLSSTPGVLSAASVGFTPLSGFGWNEMVYADQPGPSPKHQESWFNRAGAHYFATMRTPVLAGREFNDRDRNGTTRVAIVNEEFQRKFFDGKDSLGRTFRSEEGQGKPDSVYQVVGVVANTKYDRLRETTKAIAFLPVEQDPEPGENVNFVIRGRGSVEALSRTIERETNVVNSQLLLEFHSLDLQIRQSLLRDRLMANLSAGFGFLAACLSTLGLYGVMSYLVARRRAEIGLRLALGAARSNVMNLVLRDAAKMVIIGLIVGIAGSILLSRFAESLLYGLKGSDPFTVTVAALLLTTAALGATLIPALRAAWLEPVTALREE